jgi:putative transposase
MRRLLTGYAVSFNRRHRRHGHLFQNRYKSILCQEDPYLLELVRYIHLNPLRAGIVEELKVLDTYPYCGHCALMGEAAHGFQDVDYILNLFGGKVAEARRLYLEFVKKGVSAGRRPDLTGGGLVRSAGGWSALTTMRKDESRMKGDERILGQGDFVETVLKATKNGKGSERVMLLGDAGTWDERGRDIEKTEHRVLDGKRIRDEGPANRRRARVEAFGGGH